MATSVNNPTNALPNKNAPLPFIRSASGKATIRAEAAKDSFNNGKDYKDEGAPLLIQDPEAKTVKYAPHVMMTNPYILPPTREEVEALSHPDESSQTQVKYLKEAVVMDVDAKLIISSVDQMKRGVFREAHYPTLMDYMKSPHYRKLREAQVITSRLAKAGVKTKLRESDDRSTVTAIKFNPKLISLYKNVDKGIYRRLKESGFDSQLKRLREDFFTQDGEGIGSRAPNWDGGSSTSLAGREPDFTPLMAGPYNKQLYFFDYLDMHSKAFQAWCLTGDTEVALLDGRNPTIVELKKELKNKEFVWGYKLNQDTKRIEPVKLTNVYEMGEKKCVCVLLDNGKSFIASEDHPMLMKDGSYKESGELLPGDRMMPLYRVYRKPRGQSGGLLADGYERLWQPLVEKWELTHVAVMKAVVKKEGNWLFRRNGKQYVIHHSARTKEGGFNIRDNRPEKLKNWSREKHLSFHRNLGIGAIKLWSDPKWKKKHLQEMQDAHTEESFYKQGSSLRGKRQSIELIEKRTKGVKHPMSESLRRKIAKATKKAMATPEVRKNFERGMKYRNHKVVAIYPVGKKKVYHIETAETDYKNQNFALSVGVFSHNTHNPVAKRIVKVIAQFVLGKGVKLTVMKALRRGEEQQQKQQSPDAGNMVSLAQRISKGQVQKPQDWKSRCQSTLDQHWMKNTLHIKSKKILRSLIIFGEQFIRYFDAPWGLRLIQMDPSTIWEVVTDPDNSEQELYVHMQYPCIHGNTEISLLDGTKKTIEELAEDWKATKQPVWVYSYDRERKTIVPGKAWNVIKVGDKKCVTITLDNGKSLTVSEDHPVLLRDGTYCEAAKLVEGQSLMPFDRRMRTIQGHKSKKHWKLYQQIYQPTLDEWEFTHRRIAKEIWGVEEGKVVHHRNRKKRNNEPMNLRPMTSAEHLKEHAETIGRRKVRKRNRTISEAITEWHEKNREEFKRKKIGPFYKRTEESNEKISEARKEEWESGKRKIHPNSIKAAKKNLRNHKWTKKEYKARTDKIRQLHKDSKWHKEFCSAVSSGKLGKPRNHKVVSVKKVGWYPVYDLTVDLCSYKHQDNHNNIGLDCGIFVSNTRYQWFVDIPVPTIKFIIRQVPALHYFHMKINTVEGEVRGRSELFAILGWLKRLKEYASDRVIRNKMANLFVLDVAVEGDAAAVAQVQQQLAGPPTPGSFFIHNKAAEMQGVSAEVGASDTQGDWEMLLTIIAMGAGISKEYLGMGAGSGGKAQALVGTEPDIKTFEDYQELMEEFFLQDAQRVFERAKERGEIPQDITVTVEATYPSLAEENRSEKLKDFAFGESMSWWSHRRTAAAAAKEMQMTSYDYDDEQIAIATEDATKEVLFNTAYQQVTKGVDSAQAQAGGAEGGGGRSGTSSGSSGQGASGMGPGKALPSSPSPTKASTGDPQAKKVVKIVKSALEESDEEEGYEDEDTAPGTSTASRVSSFATTHNASRGTKRLPWRGVDESTGDRYRGEDPRDVSSAIQREAANLRYQRHSIGRREDRVQSPHKVRDQKSLDRGDLLTKARRAVKRGNLNKEAKPGADGHYRFPREKESMEPFKQQDGEKIQRPRVSNATVDHRGRVR